MTIFDEIWLVMLLCMYFVFLTEFGPRKLNEIKRSRLPTSAKPLICTGSRLGSDRGNSSGRLLPLNWNIFREVSDTYFQRGVWYTLISDMLVAYTYYNFSGTATYQNNICLCVRMFKVWQYPNLNCPTCKILSVHILQNQWILLRHCEKVFLFQTSNFSSSSASSCSW